MTTRAKTAIDGKAGSRQWLQRVRRLLRAWYRANARDLAWRRTRDPYAIWISEIMLQQTQVATVERYFPRFLHAFPDVQSLASADESAVLRRWEGLGYYRRARQMHAAAKKIVTEHNGIFPAEFDSVRQLPGIGRYTAGAILSIAFDAAHPILEANTIRLLSRLWAYRGSAHDGAGQAALWNAAASLLSKCGNGELNQALMELGSLICTPRNPKCEACPLASLCPTRKLGLQDRIPAPRKKTPSEELCEAAVVVQKNGSVLLRQCQSDERWAGLWDFPRFRLVANATAGHRMKKIAANVFNYQVIAGVRKLVNVSITQPRQFATLRHTVTRFRITLHGFVARCKRTSANGSSTEHRWVKPEQFADYPLSVTGRKLARLWRQNNDANGGGSD
jgi:A/G-specific adenine glycosylase